MTSLKVIFLLLNLILSLEFSTQLDFVIYKPRFKRSTEGAISKRDVSDTAPEIKEFRVLAKVANRFAVTSVLSKVENLDKVPRQTTFSVVLPTNAFISGFSMTTDGQLYKAFVKEKEAAKNIFSDSVSSGLTAGHVSVSTRNSNRFEVTVNIEPENTVDFSLVYEELLQREKGKYEVIVNIQPGQIVKKLEIEVSINESNPLSFVRTPYLRAGNVVLPQNNSDLDPHATINVQKTSAVVKFHPDIARQLHFACAGLGNKEYQGFAGQFIVEYDVERDEQGGQTLIQDGFFINFFAPQNLGSIPKHLVFILDVSGSMDGLKLKQLKDAMLKILPQLQEDDTFNIILYEEAIHVIDLDMTSYDVCSSPCSDYGNLASQLEHVAFPEAKLATLQNVEKAKNIINSLVANGITNIIGALEVGLYLVKLTQLKYKDEYKSILVFLTDGLPNVGIDNTHDIIEKVSKINKQGFNTPIYSLCIGKDADWEFMQNLSVSSSLKTTATRIITHEETSNELQDFYAKIKVLTLSDVSYSNLPSESQITQISFPFISMVRKLLLLEKVY